MLQPALHGPKSRPLPMRSRSEEHTSELQSLMRISYAVFCLKKKNPHLTTRKATTGVGQHKRTLQQKQHQINYSISFPSGIQSDPTQNKKTVNAINAVRHCLIQFTDNLH